MKFHKKLSEAAPGSFHVLDPEKAKRLGGATLYIPSTDDVRAAINGIPFGETRTIVQLRNQLAKEAGADVACPAKTIGYWKWMAFATEDEGGEPLPWWRVLKDGKIGNLLPGGAEAHRERLRNEGVKV